MIYIHNRAWQRWNETIGDHSDHCNTIYSPSDSWNWHCSNGKPTRILATRSNVCICSNDTIHSPTCNEHRFDMLKRVTLLFLINSLLLFFFCMNDWDTMEIDCRNNVSTLWGWTRRVFSDFPLDIFGRRSCSHNLVHNFHVGLDIKRKSFSSSLCFTKYACMHKWVRCEFIVSCFFFFLFF